MARRHEGETALLVGLGGAAGGGVRLLIDRPVDDLAGLPLEIVAINLLGSLALGWLTGWTSRRPRAWWHAPAGSGVLGGFTTFSGLAALPFGEPSSPLAATLALVATILLAPVLAEVGRRAGMSHDGAGATS